MEARMSTISEPENLDFPVRFRDVPKLPEVPPGPTGEPYSVKSVHRWCTVGMNGVKLRFSKTGARCTTRRWLKEFFDRVAAAESAGEDRTPAQATASHLDAVRRLAAAGL